MLFSEGRAGVPRMKKMLQVSNVDHEGMLCANRDEIRYILSSMDDR